MTSHAARLYVAAGSLLAFFLAWAGIAAHPWTSQSSATSAQAQAVATYQLRLQRDAALIRQLSALQPASAPTQQVRVVTLPPLTTTRTS
jgi:hypothetical protein